MPSYPVTGVEHALSVSALTDALKRGLYMRADEVYLQVKRLHGEDAAMAAWREASSNVA